MGLDNFVKGNDDEETVNSENTHDAGSIRFLYESIAEYRDECDETPHETGVVNASALLAIRNYKVELSNKSPQVTGEHLYNLPKGRPRKVAVVFGQTTHSQLDIACEDANACLISPKSGNLTKSYVTQSSRPSGISLYDISLRNKFVNIEGNEFDPDLSEIYVRGYFKLGCRLLDSVWNASSYEIDEIKNILNGKYEESYNEEEVEKVCKEVGYVPT